MKLPRPKQTAHAQGSATRTNTTDDRVEKHQDFSRDVQVEVEPGDVTIAATRGFKHWFSRRDAGVTIESTMLVTLTCQRDLDAIMNAGETAGHLAEKLAVEGCGEMDLYIKKFVEDVS